MTDAVLVRAPVGVTYRIVTDLDGWPRWLEGCTSRRSDPERSDSERSGTADGSSLGTAVAAPTDHHRLSIRHERGGRGGRGRRGSFELAVSCHGWRHDAGVRWDVTPPGSGVGRIAAEWWFEERREGVIVHHLVHEASVDARILRRYQDAVVSAMQAMKDHLELAVAHAAGRVP